MRTTRLLALGLVAALAAAGAAGAGPLQKRLTEAQWKTYTTANASFLKTTNQVVLVFRRCRSVTAYKDAKAMTVCFGTAPDREVAASQRYEAVLHQFDRKTVGACSDALARYQGKLQLWRYAVIGVGRSVHSAVANATNIEAQAKHALLAYNGVTQANAAFVKPCKPPR